MWGDASLWWKIADANGLTGQSAIGEGTRLFIPAGVQRNENNSQTFRPYDPMEVLGATAPTTPAPQTGGDMWDKVLGVVVAIVAVIVGIKVGKWASSAIMKALGPVIGETAAGVVGGAAGGAAGSAASQSVLVAGGVQEKFSWNAVALAAIGGGITEGLTAASDGSGWIATALKSEFVRGALSSAITQGIGDATGLQKDDFSWAGVAAAGVSASVNKLAANGGGGVFAQVTASALAHAATRSLIDGSDFGDNIMAALPDVIGQTVGNLIVGGIAGALEPESADPLAVHREVIADSEVSLPRNGAVRPLLDEGKFMSRGALERVTRAYLNRSRERSETLGEQADAAPFLIQDNSGAEELAADIVGLNPVFSVDTGSGDAYDAMVWRNRERGPDSGPNFNSHNENLRDLNVAMHLYLDGMATGYVNVPFMAGGGGGPGGGARVVAREGAEVAARVVAREGAEAAARVVAREGAEAAAAESAEIVVRGENRGLFARISTAVGNFFDSVGRRLGISCFAAGTLILTRDGLKPIEQIRDGDMVWSRSEHNIGEAAWRSVVAWRLTGEQEIYDVHVSTPDGRSDTFRTTTFRTTEMHPFWVESGGDEGTGGFVAAAYLDRGDQLRLADGSAA